MSDDGSGLIAATGPDGHRATAFIDGADQSIEVTCECGWALTAQSRDNISSGLAARVALVEHQQRATR